MKRISYNSLGTMALCVFCAGVAFAQNTPLSREDCLRIAVRESATAQAARFSRDAAQARTEHDKPTARPLVNVIASSSVQGNRLVFPRPNDTPATFVPDSYSHVDLTFEQTLYRPGLRDAKGRYLALSRMVDWDYRKEMLALCLATEKAYYTFFQAQAGVRAAKEGAEAAESYEALVLKQIEAGQAKPVDAQTVRTLRTEAQAGLRKAENGVTLALLNMQRLLGRVSAEAPVFVPPSEPALLPETPDAAIALALANRPELQTLAQSIVAAKAGVSLAKTQTSPSLSLRGQITQQTATALMPSTFMAATLEVRIPLSDGGKTRLDTQEAQAQAKRLESLLREAQEGVALEVRQALLKAREAQDQIEVQEAQRTNAEALARVATKAYEVGMGSATAMVEALRQERIAREKVIVAQFDYRLAILEFQYGQGVPSLSWDRLLPAPAKERVP
jgi:outer membrane protein TolC